jgi:hypothetical protein
MRGEDGELRIWCLRVDFDKISYVIVESANGDRHVAFFDLCRFKEFAA